MADEDDDKRQAIYEEDEPENGLFRWVSALVVLLAVAGFFGLAWYAYKNGGETVDEKDVELVKADKTPVKEAPANPGGMQIPNQDKTVYGLISGKPEKQVVERILPPPEEPMSRGGSTETWMSDRIKNRADGTEAIKTPASAIVPPMPVTAPPDAAPPVPKEQFNPAKVRATEAAGTQTALNTPAAIAAVPAGAPATSVPPVVVPGKVQAAASGTQTAPVVHSAVAVTKTVAAPQPTAKDADDSDDDDDSKVKPPVAAATQAPPAGTRVQLGSYKSQGEAESNWSKIASKFPDDLQSRKHYIVRADLGSRGVFYRLQVAPFSTPKEAEQFCLDFVSAGQGCFLTKGK